MPNFQFREYAFGRAFHVHISEPQIEILAGLAKGDNIASLHLGTTHNALIRKGLVRFKHSSNSNVEITRAGLLVYQLMIEAGEFDELERKRVETLDMEWEAEREEWNRRHANAMVKLKDRYKRDKDVAREGA